MPYPRLLFILAIGIQTALLPAAEREMPPAAKKLQEEYHSAIDAATAPIRERYLNDLTKLSEAALKAGKLVEVLALRQEINTLRAQTMTGEWREQGGGIMQIYSDGSLRHTNGATGRWTIKDDDMILDWGNGAKHTFPIVDTKNNLRGKLHEETVTLSRVK